MRGRGACCVMHNERNIKIEAEQIFKIFAQFKYFYYLCSLFVEIPENKQGYLRKETWDFVNNRLGH